MLYFLHILFLYHSFVKMAAFLFVVWPFPMIHIPDYKLVCVLASVLLDIPWKKKTKILSANEWKYGNIRTPCVYHDYTNLKLFYIFNKFKSKYVKMNFQEIAKLYSLETIADSNIPLNFASNHYFRVGNLDILSQREITPTIFKVHHQNFNLSKIFCSNQCLNFME